MDRTIELITYIGEEIIGGDNLPKLLMHKRNIVAYVGFEPPGRMHNVNKFIKELSTPRSLGGCRQ